MDATQTPMQVDDDREKLGLPPIGMAMLSPGAPASLAPPAGPQPMAGPSGAPAPAHAAMAVPQSVPPPNISMAPAYAPGSAVSSATGQNAGPAMPMPTPQKSATAQLFDKARTVKNPVGRTLAETGAGLLRAGDIAGEALLPRVAMVVPGSELETRAANKQQQEQAMKVAELQQKPELAEEKGVLEGQIQADRDAAAQKRVDTQQGGASSRTDEEVAERAKAADEAGALKKQLADQTNQTKTAQMAQQLAEFRSTDDYRKWKEKLDKETSMKVAQITAGKAPSTMLETAEFARGGLDQLSDAQQAMQNLKAKGVMGTLPANKVEDWIFGNGLVDPSLDADTRREIGRLRSSLNYTSSAAMRAHTGRTSQQIYEDFKNTLGPGQDWNALDGAIDETTKMLGNYANAGSTENINSLRGGTPATSPGAKVKTYNPKTQKLE